MAATIWYENDGDLSVLSGKKVAILGYGSQGHAHALNLRDSGVDVVVGLRPSSKSVEFAKEQGLEVKSIEDAVAEADVVMILLPDQYQAKVYKEQVGAEPEAGCRSGVRARLQHPLRLHQAVGGSSGVHGGPEGPGPYRPPRVCGRPWRAGCGGRGAGSAR